jgi:chromate transport protein ChrA
MLVTDVFLGFHEVMLFTYGAILLIGLFAQSVQWSLGVKALVSVLVWHLVVNFGVYLNSEPTRTLFDVYVSAWPFDFRLLVSTLLFSGLFWSIKALIERNAVANFADQ